MSVIADGVDDVRKSAREELRKRAAQIKVFASGGLVFPSEAHSTLYEYSEPEIISNRRRVSRLKIILGHVGEGLLIPPESGSLSELEEIVSIQAIPRVSKSHPDSTIRTGKSTINLDAYLACLGEGPVWVENRHSSGAQRGTTK